MAEQQNQPRVEPPEAAERDAEPLGGEFRTAEDRDATTRTVSAYINDHMHDIEAEGEKPFQAIGGIVELLGEDYFPVTTSAEAACTGRRPPNRPPRRAKDRRCRRRSHRPTPSAKTRCRKSTIST